MEIIHGIEEVRKALPSEDQLHESEALTNFAVAWEQEQKRFSSGMLFGQVPSAKKADKYYLWDKNFQWRNNNVKPKSGDDDLGVINLQVAPTDFSIKEYHVAAKITEEELANQDEAINIEEEAAKAVMEQLMIHKEGVFNSTFMTTGKWFGSTKALGVDFVGTVDTPKWSNYATSEPIIDLRRQISQICRLGLDKKLVKLGIGQDLFDDLVDHPKFLGRYEQTQKAIMNEDLIAAVLGIGSVHVATAVSNTSVDGAAVQTIDYMFKGSALLTYDSGGISTRQPSAGKVFSWTGLQGYSDIGIRIRRWMDDKKKCLYIIGESAFDMRITASDLGVFFSQYH